jgi:prepilin-type N-terminal cleavage/methylation domain-containing protein
MNRAGLTLLETMVALVILGLVVLAYLEVFGATARASNDAATWTQAVTYAEQGMEVAKLDVQGAVLRGPETLEGGFQRRIDARPWRPGVVWLTVTVAFPEGGRFSLDRLVEVP